MHRLIPRLTKVAGFELGSGMFINVVLPEATAEFLSRIPALPSAVSWLHAVRTPVLMRTARAQKELGWRPKHTGKATVKEMIEAYRAEREPAP